MFHGLVLVSEVFPGLAGAFQSRALELDKLGWTGCSPLHPIQSNSNPMCSLCRNPLLTSL